MRERDPEDIVYPKRRWPWIALLLALALMGALAGFIAYVRGVHLATMRIEGPAGCAIRAVYGLAEAPLRADARLPWERTLDVRGNATVVLFATAAPSCAAAHLRCTIEIDGRARMHGGDACAEWTGRVWALVPQLR